MISIITATHKRATKLRDVCLPCILSQTSRNFEWVVINDGDDPATKELFDTALNEINVKYFGTPHRGLIASRNLGLTEATGDLIGFLDDDNILQAEFVEKMIGHFSRYPHTRMSVPIRRQRRDIYRDGVRVRTGKQMIRPWPNASNEDFIKNSTNAWFDSNGFVHRRNDDIRFNPNTLIMSDYEYLLQCFSQWGLGSLRVLNEELVDYVQTNEGIIGLSSWEDWLRDLDYIYSNRSHYQIFNTVDSEPWLREQLDQARAKALAREDLPGFPHDLIEPN